MAECVPQLYSSTPHNDAQFVRRTRRTKQIAELLHAVNIVYAIHINDATYSCDMQFKYLYFLHK